MSDVFTNGHTEEAIDDYDIVTVADYLSPLPRSIRAVLRVMRGQGASKHGDAWKTRNDGIDAAAFHRHLDRHNDPCHPDCDADTGELHLAHAAARLLIRLERRLMQDGEPEDDDFGE